MIKKSTKTKQNNQEKLIKGVEDKMTTPQIESEIKSTEKQLQDFISQGKYNQAEVCNTKIEHLKSVLRQRKTKEISKRHFTEKKNLIQDKVSDIDSLNYLWDQRFEELQTKSKSALEELRKNQEEELQQLLLQFQQSPNDVKPSAKYLKLKKEEEGLVKLRKFKEAEFVRKRKEEQRKIDEGKTGTDKEISYNNYRKKLRQKHMNELQYLQNKFQAEFDELAKEKQKDMEFLDKKYSVKSKDLINQQKREDTINKFKNYGNRIANLTNNYEIKYSVGKNEYKEPKKEEKADRIYAELNDDNNKYIEDENEKTPTKEKENNKEIESENVKDNFENEEENGEKDELKDVEIPEYEN
jgi:hypothetical protein